MFIPSKIKLTNKVLYRIAKPITFESPAKINRLAGMMYDIMKANNGIGLAAPQIGVSRRIFIMEVDNQYRVCCNPEIIESSETTEKFNEGCLSFIGQAVTVARPQWVLVKYQTAAGTWIEERFKGLAAICFQHELDHLDGITMHQRQEPQ